VKFHTAVRSTHEYEERNSPPKSHANLKP